MWFRLERVSISVLYFVLSAGSAYVTSSLVVLSLPMQPSLCSVAIQMLVVMHDISGSIKYTSNLVLCNTTALSS